MDEYCELLGSVISAKELTLPRAQQLAAYITEHPQYVKLVQVTTLTRDGKVYEVLHLDVESEIPQRKLVDIREIERVAIAFCNQDDRFPEILALRNNFPQVPHLNLTYEEFPRSICLYDQDWAHVSLTWTPADMISRLRFWLSKTSTKETHAADQPLEPFLPVSSFNLVVDSKVFESSEGEATQLHFGGIKFLEKTLVKAVRDAEVLDWFDYKHLKGTAFHLKTNPVTHGVINRIPRTVVDLDNLLRPAGVSILGNLRSYLLKMHDDGVLAKSPESLLIFFVSVPMKRGEDSPVEKIGRWAFMFGKNIKELGVEVGLWQIGAKGAIARLIPIEESKKGESVHVDILNISDDFNPDQAALLNGKPEKISKRVTVVGLGALGSKTVDDLSRMGFSNFGFIDSDVFLPHNLARHYLLASAVGYSKAFSMANVVRLTHAKSAVADAFIGDLGDKRASDADKVVSEVQASDCIIDTSASETVPRYLSQDISIKAPVMSFFLTPSGNDLVFLKESTKKEVKIDCIEQQYYKFICSNESLVDLLSLNGKPLRYAGSCRDVTSRLPTNNISIFSGLASGSISENIVKPDAKICIWRMSKDYQIKRYETTVSAVEVRKLGDWTVYVDTAVFHALKELRQAKLPQETGGVLLGNFDTSRKVLYVSHHLKAPTDSVESGASFVRGKEGLADEVEKIESQTMGRLKYVGEWHSHPPGHSANQSEQDIQALATFAYLRKVDALPVLMMIVGEGKGGEEYSLSMGMIK